MALSESERGAVIKGVTVYRDGSRDKQVKSTSKDMQDTAEDADPIEMYQSGDWSDEDVREFMDKMEDVVGGDASLCPECNEGVMQAQEGCELCPVCGYSPCA
jgi:ribonucleotide reductase alpha subunit